MDVGDFPSVAADICVLSGTKDIFKNTWYDKLGRTTQGTAAEYTRIKRNYNMG
jgi:hypothetical protein